MIHVEGIGKRYRLGSGARHDTLRDLIVHRARGVFTKGAVTPEHGDADHFWALKDVSFDVAEGEVVGIIGRNGAGKSTLLKILSRITPPTEGRIRLKGRVASLLEVGTGFHPELSGRENIFMNGAILGMTRQEIKTKFDEIVAFAEVEKFLDTPVKRYSSGMYVRLAFAVAAHLEPEILVVDEVLAVGDAEFQKKCLGKMGEVAKGGRTVLFVSHNMAAVRQLCGRAIVLRQGGLIGDTDPTAAVELYLGGEGSADESMCRFAPPPDGAQVWPVSVECRVGGKPATHVAFDGAVTLHLVVDVLAPVAFQVGLRIVNSQDIPVFTATFPDLEVPRYEPRRYRFECTLPSALLAPGRYSLVVALHHPGREVFFLDERALYWTVEETGSKMARYAGKPFGVVIVDGTWAVENAS
ncbi:MAG: ABC transporter ATP-binding protein [Nitrospirae bacterium]|nr:ABC transporter ATP-binding protein [Nitrospirota bacterium]